MTDDTPATDKNQLTGELFPRREPQVANDESHRHYPADYE
jgi:hypothetical protein